MARRRSPRWRSEPRAVEPVDVIVGPGQPLRAGGKAPGGGLVGHRRGRRPERAGRDRRRERRPRAGRARSRRAGRARRRQPPGAAERGRRAARRSRRRGGAVALEDAPIGRRTRRSRWSRCRTSRRRSTLANAIAPEHLELACDGRRLDLPRDRPRRLRVRRSGGDRIRRLRWRAPTTYCRPVARRASPARSGVPVSAPAGAGIVARRGRAGARAVRQQRRTRRGIPRARGIGRGRRDAETRARRRQRPMMATTTPPRAAEIERSTSETQIRLRAEPRRRRATSSSDRCRVPRPHARPACASRPNRPERARRPAISRPARTTRPRTSGSCSARRSTRRSGDRSGITRYGDATFRWTRRSAACAIDISGRPYCSFEGDAAADFDRRLRHRAGGGVLPRRGQQRKADPAPPRARRGQCPPHDRSLLQGVRARVAAGDRRSTPAKPGIPSTKGVL